MNESGETMLKKVEEEREMLVLTNHSGVNSNSEGTQVTSLLTTESSGLNGLQFQIKSDLNASNENTKKL